jgi:hypothetical protein
MGILEISVGCTLVWPVPALEDRVKAASAVHRMGQSTYFQDTREPDLAATGPAM